jgi:hypothetical protein
MAKVLSLEETTAQWCQIREGEPTAETAQLCQKEESTARECQTAWSARRRRQSERIKNANSYNIKTIGSKRGVNSLIVFMENPEKLAKPRRSEASCETYREEKTNRKQVLV